MFEQNAALLLFARYPALKWHPRAGVRVFRVWGRERRHGRNRNVVQVGRADPPVAHAIDEAARLAGAQVRPFERLDGLHFKRVQEYPGLVWREALVNAIAHRDYRIQARETEIWFYDDRFEAVSPGDLIAPIRADRLGRGAQVHATRNPMLVRVLVEVGAMRARGQGIARIFGEMAKRRLPEPEIVCQDGLFTMKVFGEGARLS